MHADVCPIEKLPLRVMAREEAIIDDLVEAVVRIEGHPLPCRENPQMALEMHRFKAAAIRQRGIADDLQLHQLRKQIGLCVRN
jgi:hypothetical protein